MVGSFSVGILIHPHRSVVPTRTQSIFYITQDSASGCVLG